MPYIRHEFKTLCEANEFVSRCVCKTDGYGTIFHLIGQEEEIFLVYTPEDDSVKEDSVKE